MAAYFRMLMLELAGQAYSKTDHRRALMSLLDGRTESAVELKHQNISAILIELGCPYIDGYKRRDNYQSLLFDVVEHRVREDALFNRMASESVERAAVAPSGGVFESILEPAPELRPRVEAKKAVPRYAGVGVKRDYLAREARNAALGRAGEEFVVALEHGRLSRLGKDKLADRVEHVSATRGDGLGFDVLSFEPTGQERFIEVKTTSFGKETPFFVSSGELTFSRDSADRYFLYRVFSFRRDPRLFTISGAIDRRCQLDPVSYMARFS